MLIRVMKQFITCVHQNGGESEKKRIQDRRESYLLKKAKKDI